MPDKYLKLFPRPVLEDLATGRWLPIVGAGMSLNATLPAGRKMPLWKDLGEALADELTNYTPSSPLDGISAYEQEYDRARLVERLSTLLYVTEAKPGVAHKEFCSIPFDIVCTTNFDCLLERQYDATPRHVYPVVNEDQLSIGLGGSGTLLLKLHGDLRHPSRLVVTEADYDGFLTNYPLIATYLANQLITKTAIFIGYSLEDPDFRQIWSLVANRLGRTVRKGYTMVVGASPTEVARWERRGVKVINLVGKPYKYGEILAEVFRELREYLRNTVLSVSRVTEEKPLEQLLLPRKARTRLCFFSLPLELVPVYRELVFPAVKEAGFVPVTADDVVTPGDSLSAKIDMLIDRSATIIIDDTSASTRADYDMALARINELNPQVLQERKVVLIIVTSEANQLPRSESVGLDQRGVSIVHRPDILSEEPGEFVGRLVDAISHHRPDQFDALESEPSRLLAAGEYRAVVISVMSLLESRLREHVGDIWPPANLRMLLARVRNKQLLTEAEVEKLQFWIQVRNKVVHSSLMINKTEASSIVEDVMPMIKRFQKA